MDLFRCRSRPEQLGRLGKTLFICLFCKSAVLAIGLRLAGKCLFQELFSIGHDNASLGNYPSFH